MFVDNKEYFELLALTQRYLLQEYRQGQLIPIDSEAYYFFKKEAQATSKGSKNEDVEVKKDFLKKPQIVNDGIDDKKQQTLPNPAVIPLSMPSSRPSNEFCGVEARQSPEVEKSRSFNPAKLIGGPTSTKEQEKIVENENIRSSLSRELPAVLPPPPNFEEIRLAIQKQLPNFPWREAPRSIKEPQIPMTATLLLISCECDEASRAFFRAVETAISSRLQPCTLVELGGLPSDEVQRLWYAIASLPGLRHVILAGAITGAAIPSGATLLPIEAAAAYLQDPQKKRALWSMLSTYCRS